MMQRLLLTSLSLLLSLGMLHAQATGTPSPDCIPMQCGTMYNFDDVTSRYVLYQEYESETQTTTNFYMEECWRGLGTPNGTFGNVYPYIATDHSVYHMAYSGSGVLHMYCYSYTPEQMAAVMPTFVGDADTLCVRFMARPGYVASNSLYNEDQMTTLTNTPVLRVGTLTDPQNMATFQLLETIAPAGVMNKDPEDDPEGTAFWREYTVNLEGAEGTYICFCFKEGGSDREVWDIDNVQLLRADDCLRPRGLKVSHINTSSATFTWQRGRATDYQLALILGTDTTFYTIQNAFTYTLSGLQHSSDYRVVVRAKCSATEYSEWSDAVDFATECLKDIPFVYSFDINDTYTTADGYRVPNCWHTQGDYYGGAWAKYGIWVTNSTSLSYSGAYSLEMNHSTRFADTAWVALPELNTSRLDTLELSFRMRAMNDDMSFATSSYAHSIQIGTISQMGDMSDFHLITTCTTRQVALGTNQDQDADRFWERFRVPLDNQGGNIIVLLSSFLNDNHIFIDDIRVDRPQTCLAPSTLTISDVTKHTATAQWTGSAAQYRVSLFNGNTRLQTSVQDSTTAHFTGLNPGVKYTVRIASVCGGSDGDDIALLFTTPAAVPYMETFDDASNMPADWSQYEGLASSVFTGEELIPAFHWYPTDKSYSNCMETNHTRCEFFGTDTKYWLVSPTLQLDEVPAGMSIRLKHDIALTKFGGNKPAEQTGCTDDRFLLCFSTDQGQTWTEQNTIEWNTDGSGEHSLWELSNVPERQYFDVSEYIGGTLNIAYYIESTVTNVDNHLYLDNVCLEAYWMDCPGLKSISVDSVGLQGATVHLDYLGAQPVAEVLLCSANDTNTVLMRDTAYGTIYRLPALQQYTHYYVFARQIVPGSHISHWLSADFTTPYAIRYDAVFTSQTTLPDGWQTGGGLLADVLNHSTQIQSFAMGWTVYYYKKDAFYQKDVYNGYRLRAEYRGENDAYWAISPILDLSPNVGQGIALSFSAMLAPYNTQVAADRNSGIDDRLVVLITTDNGQNWRIFREWNNMGTGDYILNDIKATSCSDYVLDLSMYAGQNIRIAWYSESTASNAHNYLHVGKIKVDTIPTYTYYPTICYGDDYDGQVDGNSLYIPFGQYDEGMNIYNKFTDMGALSCMEVVNLQVNSPATYDYLISVCEGSHYTDENFDFVASLQGDTLLQRIYTRSSGCDSVVSASILVWPLTIGEVQQDTTCDSQLPYNWHGRELVHPGTYVDTLPSTTSGCDSIATLILTIEEANDEVEAVLCYGDSMLINNTWIYEGGVYEEPFTTPKGCEGTRTYYVEGKPDLRSHIYAILCPGEEYNDPTFMGLTKAGIYVAENIRSVNGCDSTITLSLYTVTEDRMSLDIYITPADLPVVIGGQTLLERETAPGTYNRSVTTSCGVVDVTITLSATGLNDILHGEDAPAAEKFWHNGQLYIRHHGQVYNAVGGKIE